MVSYCDKFDGFGEAMHEVWAGNKAFCRPAGGSEARGGYVRRLWEFPDKYPQLAALLSQEHPMFRPQRIDFEAIAKNGKYHTIEDKYNAERREKELELDSLLDKIAKNGFHSLSAPEKKRLEQLSGKK